MGHICEPGYWGQGIGSELLGWTAGELKKRGYTSVSLWVLEENASARAFYEKHGFKADGAKKELELGRKLILMRYIREIA